ncbi:RNA polymerase sigma factor [bacterium]|nr:RNA polymerase sigma factor [bacterium]
MSESHTLPSEEELVEIAQSSVPGDTRAFTALVERTKDRVLANCRFLSGSKSDAEDLAQEVFVKVYAALPRFESRSRVYTWIQRIKINHCLTHLRNRRNRTFLDVTDPVLESADEMQIGRTADEVAGAISQRDRVRITLDSLPDTLRIPLVMCDVDGFAYQEIAESLDLGLSATKMRIKRGRELFRERYDAAEATGPPLGAAAAEEIAVGGGPE